MFKILIVDPNTPFRRSLKKVLVNRFPFIEIREAAGGNSGLELVKDFSPNLIFLEIHLPSQNGLDLARQIKADHPDMIIVILTSYHSPEYQAAAQASGVEHLVPKNEWTAEDLIALTHTILNEHDVNADNIPNRSLPTKHPF